MTTAAVKNIVDLHSYSDHIIFSKGKYIVFGNDNVSDLVKIGLSPKIKNEFVYENGKIQQSSKSEISELFSKVMVLQDPNLIASFRIKPYQVKFIHKIVKFFNATHLKFYGNQDGVFVNFIDILKAIPEARMNRKYETRLLYHQLKNTPVAPFDLTINATSFLILSATNLHLGIGDNKIGIFTDDEAGDTYLLRDPEIFQPVINTFSDRLQQDISFVFPAMSSLLSEHTTQPVNLESELDLEDF
jgi:hypothetical protein